MRRGRSKGRSKGPLLTQTILRFPYYRLRLALGLFLSLILTGTLGYHWIEHWGIVDSLFMTVITLAINPAATDFIEGVRLAEGAQTSLFEFIAGPSVDRRLFGQIDFKKKTGALVVAIRRSGEFTANPPDSFVVRTGDAIIAIGSVKELERMAKLVNPDAPVDVELPPEAVK